MKMNELFDGWEDIAVFPNDGNYKTLYLYHWQKIKIKNKKICLVKEKNIEEQM